MPLPYLVKLVLIVPPPPGLEMSNDKYSAKNELIRIQHPIDLGETKQWQHPHVLPQGIGKRCRRLSKGDEGREDRYVDEKMSHSREENKEE